jgi:DNA-binding protein HU-beta
MNYRPRTDRPQGTRRQVLSADFRYPVLGDVISIVDLDLGNRSVTNDIENVLRRIELYRQGSIDCFSDHVSDKWCAGWREWDGEEAHFILWAKFWRKKLVANSAVGNARYVSFPFFVVSHTQCAKLPPLMTKSELQSALAEATETTKSTAGVFLDTLTLIAAKEIRKKGEFVLPGFGKLLKQKRKARMGFNPKTQTKIKIPAKTVVKFRVAKSVKDAVLGVKK